jgi:hypothetical protein
LRLHYVPDVQSPGSVPTEDGDLTSESEEFCRTLDRGRSRVLGA